MAKKVTTRKSSKTKNETLRVYAGLFFILDLLDSYELVKMNDNAISLKIRIGSHENLIVVHTMQGPAQPLGEWISKLPPSVFQDRMDRVNEFNEGMGG